MLRKRILCLVMAVCALLVLTGCQEKEVFSTELPEKQAQTENQETMPQTQNLFGTDEVGQTPVDFDDGSYDPASEEGGDEEEVTDPADVVAQVVVAITPQPEYPNAGATPVPIDPIDKPTPTPLPTLTFAYQTYTAGSLHLTFEAPAGWIVDESQPDTYVLTNPDVSMAYAASLTVRAVPVNKKYDKSALTKELKGMLDTLGSSGLKNWEPSNTANRTFLNSTGVYANYKATSGKEAIAGRIIVCCVDKTLYTLHVTYPRGYTETYVDKVFDQFRHTVKITE